MHRIPVSLALTLGQTPEHIEVQVESRFADPAVSRGAMLYMALTENRLSSAVTAGEKRPAHPAS